PCLRIETICASLNFDFFMKPPGWKDARKFYLPGVRDQGKLTDSQGVRSVFESLALHASRSKNNKLLIILVHPLPKWRLNMRKIFLGLLANFVASGF
ncbi:MAG: hypothetical protein QM599_06850, partial [Pseudoxanthomonas sp.]